VPGYDDRSIKSGRDYIGLAFQGIGIVVAAVAVAVPVYASLQGQLTDGAKTQAALTQRIQALEDRENRDFTTTQTFVSSSTEKLDRIGTSLQDLSTQMIDLRRELKR